MNYKKVEIKKGINFHIINTNKFKTNLLAIFITVPLNKENVTKNALLPMVLRSGTQNMKSQDQISIKLEEMYGASFDCGVDKIGDNQVLKFYLETINDKFLPNQEKLLKQSINNIIEIAFNPLLENGKFKDEYVNREKENLKQIIEGKIDNKATYALERCIEEMYKNQPYGLYKFGYNDDLEKINPSNLYEYYKNLIDTCKIDIFASGELENIKELISENESIVKLKDREIGFIKESEKEPTNEIKQIEDKMEVSQGKLVIGLDVETKQKEEKYTALVYNAILRRNSKF